MRVPMSDVVEYIDPDYAFVQAALQDDDAAFAELVKKYKGRILQMTYRFAANDHDQDDMTQEIFIHLHKKLGSYKVGAPFEHWFMRLAHNYCCNWVRRNNRYVNNHVSSELLLEMTRDTATVQSASREEARQLLNFALDGLAAQDKIIITLLELDEKSVREVAALTGLTEANVKVKAHRARKKMAENLRSVYEK